MSTAILSSFFLALFLVFMSVSEANDFTKGIFIFGDSIVDAGTNTYVPGAKAKADFPHNGIDFPHQRATGRFSNGFNSADYLSKLMGQPRSPYPYLLLARGGKLGKHCFRGVNFASGAAGILDVTDKEEDIVQMSEQVKQFETVKQTLISAKGQAAVESYLAKSMFVICVGSNDVFDYLVSRRDTVAVQDFLGNLTAAFEGQIKTLHHLGARKFGVIGLPPIGCCPSMRIYNATGGCFAAENQLAQGLNFLLYSSLFSLNDTLPGMNFSFANTFTVIKDIVDNPHRFHFKNVENACCGTGKFNAETPCAPNATVCSNRNDYLFWDRFHPTQRAAKLAAETIYNGGRDYVNPINFAQLNAAA